MNNSGGSTIDAKAMTLPSMEHSRQTRALKTSCPMSYCEDDLQQAQCSTRNCPGDRVLPSCWFAMDYGTTMYFSDPRFRDNPKFGRLHYLHHTNRDLSCLPCCQLSSYVSRMPSKIVIFEMYYNTI